MITTGIAAATALTSAIYSGVQQNRAQKEMDAALASREATLKNYFDREYYQNYLDRSDVQSFLSQLRSEANRRTQTLQNSAPMQGFTPEAVAAQKKNEAVAYSNSLSQIAAGADPYRSQQVENYLNNMGGITSSRVAQSSNVANQMRNQFSNALPQATYAAGNFAASFWDKK